MVSGYHRRREGGVGHVDAAGQSQRLGAALQPSERLAIGLVAEDQLASAPRPGVRALSKLQAEMSGEERNEPLLSRLVVRKVENPSIRTMLGGAATTPMPRTTPDSCSLARCAGR